MTFVTKGTKTTTGGVVLEGHNDILIDGKPATSVGQKASCASGRKSCKGVGEIVQVGDNCVYLPNGSQAALPDYKVLCNCHDNFILEPQSGVNIGSGSGAVNLGGNVNMGAGVNINMGSAVSFASVKGVPPSVTESNPAYGIPEQQSNTITPSISQAISEHRKYKPVSETVKKTQPAFLLIEGIGGLGGYTMTVSYAVENNNLFISAFVDIVFSGSPLLPPASSIISLGTGVVKLIVDNKVIKESPLVNDKSSKLLPTDSIFAGSTNIILPDPNQVQEVKLAVSAGYIVSSYIGTTYPKPKVTTKEISVEII